MTKGFLRFGAVLILAIATATPLWAVRQLVGHIIARVNGDVITNWQFEREEEKLRSSLSERYQGSELDAQLKEQSKNLLRDLIDQDLMVQKAKDADINVETDVVKRLDTIRKNMHLETQADLQQAVEKQGHLWEDFEDSIRRNLLMQELIGREVGSRIVISREDARKYYDTHKDEFNFPEGEELADVLVATKDRTPEEAQKRAEQALAEIKGGARWESVVQKYSEDDQTRDNNGDLGFFKKGTLAADLSAAIAKVEAGDTTGVLKTQYGFMILKVLHRSKSGLAPFEDVEQKVDETLYNQKMQPALRDYLTTLRRQSFITIAPGFVDSGAAKGGGLDFPKDEAE
ncbi:MAG: peptidylprolyl isomerase [Deltaproteobacteria bacterium]